MSRCLAPEVEDRATLEQLQCHLWLQPTCLAQGEGKGSEGEDLSQHGRMAPVLSLGHEQRGARRSPPKPEPSGDECLSHAQISQQFLSACSSLWTCYSCQSTGPQSSCPPSTQPAASADTSLMLLSYSEPGALARSSSDFLLFQVIEGVSVLLSHQAREAVQETDQ
ncbi:hypothetical protein SKAU_G00384560 [Synaphobranchus kaupii]|uniref:Uncharacterized protein n=1 Tax=Synaphobranchus kaupii TaxID=118154 RepID=A0A9Q1EED1_SYNKA|nr:hypothetical protein SKAU_G00384560 [Synaphobranchus kaupii]